MVASFSGIIRYALKNFVLNVEKQSVAFLPSGQLH